MVALDRIAGTTALACIAGLSAWLIGQTIQMSPLETRGAAASSAPAAAYSALKPDFNLPAAGVEAEQLTAADYRKVQSKLQRLGFNPGEIDGIPGGRTLDALNHYREAKNLKRVFKIDRATVAGLLD